MILPKRYLFFIILIITSCKINQYRDGKKAGKWIEETTEEGVKYKFISFYNHNGIERGRWKTYRNDTLVFTEKYNGSVSYVKNFYNNGKILSKGKSKMDRSNPEKIHWFYFGEWKYYLLNGKLQYLRLFDNGREIKEIKVNAK